MKKILVIGTSGAGKTSLARRLADVLAIPFLPTDPFYWSANWKAVPEAEVLITVGRFMDQDSWILDGNFESNIDDVWTKADTIVWLDYSLSLTLSRNIRRNVWWYVTRDSSWSGNRMSIKRVLSGAVHCVKSFRRKRQVYAKVLAKFPDLNVLHFRRPKEAADWFDRFAAT